MSYDIGPTTLDEYRLALDNANERTRAALAERDAADAHRLTFREEAERVLAEHRSRAEAAEKERDLAREVVESTTREAGTAIHAAESERDALRDQIEHEGCATSHLGERTYSCRAESLCGLCRLRLERDAARKERDQIEAAARAQSFSGHDWNRLLGERDAARDEVARLREAIRVREPEGPDVEPCTCRECGDTYCLRDGEDPTPECDRCAHVVLERARRALTPGETP